MNKLLLSSKTIDVWPQGGAGKVDDLLPDGFNGNLNEQVLWFRHKSMDDSRSALRVPEGITWKGRAPGSFYQVGQKWALSGDRLLYEDCPITYPSSPSPGKISALVEFIEDEVVEVRMRLTNTSDEPMEDAYVHSCFNHRRAPLLGRLPYARAGEEWVDFTQYLNPDPDRSYFRIFRFKGGANPKGLPEITIPILFSETVHPDGSFVSVIGSRDASSLMSNVDWPCTDLWVDFGTIEPGETHGRELLVGLGVSSKDDWLDLLHR